MKLTKSNKLKYMPTKSLKNRMLQYEIPLVWQSHPPDTTGVSIGDVVIVSSPVPTVTAAEISELSTRVIKAHHQKAVSLACLVQLTLSSFSRQSSDLSPLLALQQDCIEAYLREQGICKSEVVAALAALQRAGQTAEYLDLIPA